uniref:Uncharacterized protein n=1 Tax=Mycena chlorophos TaxID=658473 RepID=A0ABQ0LBD3_MYCCL|nr:predicted protein [Mycena chlorophos]
MHHRISGAGTSVISQAACRLSDSGFSAWSAQHLMSANIEACVNLQATNLATDWVAYKLIKYQVNGRQRRQIGEETGTVQVQETAAGAGPKRQFIVTFSRPIPVMPSYEISLTIQWETAGLRSQLFSWWSRVLPWIAFDRYRPRTGITMDLILPEGPNQRVVFSARDGLEEVIIQYQNPEDHINTVLSKMRVAAIERQMLGPHDAEARNLMHSASLFPTLSSASMSQAEYAVDPRRELNTLEALKAYAIQDPYWKGLLTSYANIIDHIIAYRVDRDPKKFGSQAAYMTGLSGIATLLAAAQVTFIQVVFTDPLCITSTSPKDCDSNSVILRDVIIFLTYIALAFEILGAVSSLLTAKRLIELSNHSRALLEAKSTLEKSISSSSSSANPPSELLLGHQKETASLFSEIDVHVHHRKHSAGGLRTVIAFILAGMICFFAALFFEVVISQPARLSGPFIAAVVIMVAVLAWIEKRASPELRKRFRRSAGDEEIALRAFYNRPRQASAYT